MRILAIDTALEACSAAVLDTEAGGLIASEQMPMQRGHAEALMPLIARVIDQAGVEFADIDRIGVTVGPGSFTGLRVGIAAARGIALTAGRPAVGVSTFAAYAAPHISGNPTATVVAAIDARHAQVYLQMFGPGGRTLVAPRIVPVRDAVRAASGGAIIVGHAAAILADNWPAGEAPPALVEQKAAPDIAWVTRLAAVADPAQAPPKPLYLRAPDAKPQEPGKLLRQ